MPTDEFKPLLDRDEAIRQATPLIEASAPLLRELVNHASVVFHSCTEASEHMGGENEDLAPFILYRHTMELIDGIEMLLRSSCVDASVPVLRAAFEASLSLDYIMRADYTRRSLAWTCGYTHSRIKSHQKLDPTTPSGLDFAAARAKEMSTGAPPFKGFDSAPHVAAMERVLSTPNMQPVEAEYQRVRSLRKGRHPHWFQLFDGPADRRALAGAVERGWEYLTLYGEWSGFSHAADASPYLRSADAGGAAFLAVRAPHEMAQRASLAASIMLRSTRLLIDHFRKGEDLSAWYRREIQGPYLSLGKLRVTVVEHDA